MSPANEQSNLRPPPGRWRREWVTMAERDVVAAVEGVAAMFSRYPEDPDLVATIRDHEARAVLVYLLKASLGWGLSRIGRRIPGGITLQHAMRILPKGRALIVDAVTEGRITPERVAALLPREAYL